MKPDPFFGVFSVCARVGLGWVMLTFVLMLTLPSMRSGNWSKMLFLQVYTPLRLCWCCTSDYGSGGGSALLLTCLPKQANDSTKMRSELRGKITQMLCMEFSPSGRMDFTRNGNENTGFYQWKRCAHWCCYMIESTRYANKINKMC